jgi:hypothetical protein
MGGGREIEKLAHPCLEEVEEGGAPRFSRCMYVPVCMYAGTHSSVPGWRRVIMIRWEGTVVR